MKQSKILVDRIINFNTFKFIPIFTGFALLQLPDFMCYLRYSSEDWCKEMASTVRRVKKFVSKCPFSSHNEDNDCNHRLYVCSLRLSFNYFLMFDYFQISCLIAPIRHSMSIRFTYLSNDIF